MHNFSSYELLHKEMKALSYGLDHHIPSKINTTQLQTEFEHFYQNLLRNMTHIQDDDLTKMRTKVLSTFQKYNKVKVPYKHLEIVQNLNNNSNIVLLKQDKGRRIVILDKTKYTEKCLLILTSQQFQKCKKDPTTQLERKIQNTL